MRVPFRWLREMAPAVPDDPTMVGELLTLLGLELDVIAEPPADPSGVVAARVVARADIEGARACLVTVDAGPHGMRQVVCGAHNFAPGDLLPLALPGARLASGMDIARRDVKLPRGPVTSDGMLCSPIELGVGDDAAGILHLDAGAEGDDVRGLLGLDDPVLVLEITPNRPDAMSMRGVARELRAHFGGQLHVPAPAAALPATGFPIEIADPDLCPRYVGIVIEGVTVGPSPAWAGQRLRAAGMRPINNVVDATNYVMLERGQPLHAFDLVRLEGPRITVRRARAGEHLVTLDDLTRTLEAGDLVIADASRAVALAGVMGGAATEVSPATTALLLESAMFLNTSVLQTSKRLGLRSEASSRFERGVDPEATMEAALRAAAIITEWGGGQMTGGTDACPRPHVRRRVTVRAGRVNGLLGTSLSDGEQRRLLERIELTTTDDEQGYVVEVPGFRPDIHIEADVAEEVARLHGYNRIARTLPSSPQRIGSLNRLQLRRRRLRDLMLGAGCDEVSTLSFASPDELQVVGTPSQATVRLLNPLQAENSLLRPSLFTNLLGVARANIVHRRTDLEVFELGTVFAPSQGSDVLPREHLELGVLLTGRAEPSGPHATGRRFDVFDMKGILEVVAAGLGCGLEVAAGEPPPGFHPGKSARLLCDGHHGGAFGEVHPAVAARFDIEQRILVALVDADLLLRSDGRPILYDEISRFPEADRDVNVTVGEEVAAASLLATVEASGAPLLRRATIVDLYRGPQVGEGRKSVTFALSFGDPARTLTDHDVASAVEKILHGLAANHGAALRT